MPDNEMCQRCGIEDNSADFEIGTISSDRVCWACYMAEENSALYRRTKGSN